MPLDSDIQMDEMMEEMAEDLGKNREPEINKYRAGDWTNFPAGWPLILGGVALVILIAIVISFLLSGGGIPKRDLKSITNGLALIEKRLNKLEEIEGKTVEFENQIKDLRTSVSELQSFKISSEKHLSSLSQKMEQNREGPAARTKISNPDPTGSSPGNGRYHIVKKGETLYRISQKYGLEVDELRRINRLKSKEDIFPDQRLLVAR